MMFAKFSDFLTPCLHLDLFNAIKFTQPPLLDPLFNDPLPPLIWTSYLKAPKEGTRHVPRLHTRSRMFEEGRTDVTQRVKCVRDR